MYNKSSVGGKINLSRPRGAGGYRFNCMQRVKKGFWVLSKGVRKIGVFRVKIKALGGGLR